MSFASARKDLGLTLHEVGEKIGCHFSTIHKWEKGRVPLERVVEIEAKLGIARHQIRPDVFPPPATNDVVQQRATV